MGRKDTKYNVTVWDPEGVSYNYKAVEGLSSHDGGIKFYYEGKKVLTDLSYLALEADDEDKVEDKKGKSGVKRD